MPAHTYIDQNLAEPLVLALPIGSCAVYSHRNPEKQTANEDAAAIVPGGTNSVVLAVADGCGGMVTGEEAARITIETLCGSVQNAAVGEDPLRVAILDAIEAVRDAMC